MSHLAALQSAFVACVLDEDRPLPAGWTERQAAGMAIYRNNYRVALVDALRSTFARTLRWVGDDAFRQAAAHHLISHPPTSWTLDDVGEGFDATLASLFAGDPEVAELAWVEWTMHQLFGAADAMPLDAAGFAEATAHFAEDDWEVMRLAFMPQLATRLVGHDMAAIWHSLDADGGAVPDYALEQPLACHVYREGEQPVFIMAPMHEASALAAMLGGASFGEACQSLTPLFAANAAAEAGAMLGRWLHHGMIRAVLLAP